jgi:hypothetical protein
MDLENAMRVINGVSGFTEDDTGVGMAWLVVTDHIESQAATIARLEAELERVGEHMPKTCDGEPLYPRRIVWWISKDGTDLRECQVSEFWDWPSDPDDFTEVGPTCWEVNNRGIGRCGVDCYSSKAAALSARQNGEGVGDE